MRVCNFLPQKGKKFPNHADFFHTHGAMDVDNIV